MESKDIYLERKANGICTACGKRKARKNKTMCLECLTKMRNRITRMRRAKGILPREEYGWLGLCKICGKAPMMNGRKVCEKCLVTLQKNAEVGRAAIDMKNHPFRKENDLHFSRKALDQSMETILIIMNFIAIAIIVYRRDRRDA